MEKQFLAASFIEKSKIIHGTKYDYSMVKNIDRSSYVKVEIGCPLHGFFLQEAGYHIRGSGCPKCGRQKVNRAISKQFESSKFIVKATEIHGQRYNYSLVLDAARSTHHKVNLICPDHGVFTVCAKDHIGQRGGRCPRCSKKESYGEFLIRKYLSENHIIYEKQKKFDDLRDTESNRKLAFDFYLPDYNALIEFDGEYHFNPPNFSRLSDVELKKLISKIKCRDDMKTKYANNLGFSFLRIHYSNRNPKAIANKIEQLIAESRK